VLIYFCFADEFMRSLEYTLRAGFATHLLERGTDIRVHGSINTTMIYSHIAPVDGKKIVSPLDNLP